MFGIRKKSPCCLIVRSEEDTIAFLGDCLDSQMHGKHKSQIHAPKSFLIFSNLWIQRSFTSRFRIQTRYFCRGKQHQNYGNGVNVFIFTTLLFLLQIPRVGIHEQRRVLESIRIVRMELSLGWGVYGGDP